MSEDYINRLLHSVRQIRNAAYNMRGDTAPNVRRKTIWDLSVLYGSVFPHKVKDLETGTVISPATCSATTVSIYQELGEDAPIEVMIPPATVVEIIYSLDKEARRYKKVADQPDVIAHLTSIKEKVWEMSSAELSQYIQSIPNEAQENGLHNLAAIFASPHFKSCTEGIGKDALIEAHRRSKPIRDRLIGVFQSKRNRFQGETEDHFRVRNWADGENLALPIGYSDMEGRPEVPAMVFTGPVPVPKKISEADRSLVLDFQRNFVVPFLHVTYEKESLSTKGRLLKDGEKRAALSIIEAQCDAVLDNIPSRIMPQDLLSTQINAIVGITNEISRLKQLGNQSPQETQKEREKLMEKLKSTKDVKDTFMNHAERLDMAAKELFETMPELNDDEILDEFDLKEIRENHPKKNLG